MARSRGCLLLPSLPPSLRFSRAGRDKRSRCGDATHLRCVKSASCHAAAAGKPVGIGWARIRQPIQYASAGLGFIRWIGNHPLDSERDSSGSSSERHGCSRGSNAWSTRRHTGRAGSICGRRCTPPSESWRPECYSIPVLTPPEHSRLILLWLKSAGSILQNVMRQRFGV
jgi:hypothetical protein